MRSTTSEKTDPPRERLLQTAGRLFHLQGYHQTGINQIIEEAGIAKATFYNHFNSKDTLAVAWLKSMQRASAAKMEGILENSALPARSRLLSLFDWIEQSLEDCHFRGCPNLNMLSEVTDPRHPIREEVRIYKARERETFQLLSLEALGDGNEKHALKLGDTLYFMMEGALAEAQSHASIEPIRRARYLASILIDRAFETRPSP